jgi:hypothetical protein
MDELEKAYPEQEHVDECLSCVFKSGIEKGLNPDLMMLLITGKMLFKIYDILGPAVMDKCINEFKTDIEVRRSFDNGKNIH